MSRVLLVGLGGVGSVYAHIFQKSGAQLSVVARSNYQKVKDDGMTLKSTVYGDHLMRFDSLYNKVPADQFDYVVCTNKALEPDQLPGQIKDAVSKETAIVLIQNGVGAEQVLRDQFPDNTIITCVSYIISLLDGPNTAVHKMKESLDIGTFDEKRDGVDGFCHLLDQAKSGYTLVDDIMKQRWWKCVWNAAVNSLTALSMLMSGPMLDSSDMMPTVFRRFVGEMNEIAKAEGHDLGDVVNELHERLVGYKSVSSSMRADMLAGKQMEAEVILGNPIRIARNHGIDTPTLDMAYALIKAHNLRLTQPNLE